MAERDPITCHALDTTTGRPAAGINVELSLVSDETIVFKATTNSDGRIANWHHEKEKVGKLIESGGKKKSELPLGSSVWKLRFETGAYYGLENTFFPFVELNFVVKEGEHFHVPLLLGPFSYTTYRGS
ncbi:hypothetical protein MFRU_004g04500 [Monilinia fructicola]|uniref:5-hydroxyisourate hydrolase n=1 Tax=Monilinia fructicola TaxID=38448 RepID=A0A5M9JLZ0_MONFR|nr:hypothetical protein EYC84_001339 [Monilinia fructicola]KAG4033955.1 hypothetical protein MFRU_004g04500 [Monilinia fructicola]